MAPRRDTPPWKGTTARLPLFAAAMAVVVCGIVLFYLASNVGRQIDLLATARSDSGHWSVAQAEVEFLALQLELERAQANDGSDLNDLRRRFDVFYSRINTITEGRQFKGITEQPEVMRDIALIRDFLDRNVPLIDGPGIDLRAALPEIAADGPEIRAAVRRMSINGVDQFAHLSAQQRITVGGTLARIAWLTAVMVAVLVLLVFVLWRVAWISRSHARREARTRVRMESIISTSIDAILVVDTHGRILDCNGAAERVFGHDRTVAIGARLGDVLAHESLEGDTTDMARFLDEVSPGTPGGLVQLEGKRRNGSRFPVEMSIAPAQSEDEKIYVSFLRDISDRVTAQHELESARDKAVAGELAKANLLAVMSHEMRTPLNGLLGTLDLLSDTSLDPEQSKAVAVMRTSGDLLLHHVNDVLDISRLDAGRVVLQTSVFDAATLVEDILAAQREAAAQRGNVLRADVGGASLESVSGDPVRVQQVLLNLVGNAMKFTRDGEIRVEAERLADDRVEIRVTDTGVGIAAEDLTRIFEDFVTLDSTYARREEGTGLGLAITQRIVTAMGGEIGAESEPGEGSLFWMRLPLPVSAPDKSADGTDAAAPAKSPRMAQGARVLVVEDNPVNRFVARAMLEREGCQVTEAHDGAQGVEMAGAEHFDMVLMDISMPVLDGTEATRKIRASNGPNRATRIVALTAHAMPEELERFTRAGLDDTLVKPISRTALRGALAAVQVPEAEAEDGEDTRPAPTPRPTVDPQMLADLQRDLGADRARTIIGDFLADTERRMDTLERCRARRGDPTDIVRELHRIAGAAAVLGADDLHASAIALECACSNDEAAETAHPQWQSLTAAWDVTRTTLEAHLQRLDA